ncbi:MAG TPA: hypothetical protein VMT35_13550 [Ignavibacteriaceae bacterium]|nr:hypothetical protein [Ignavibacteriaceae bacterium]
MDKLPIQFKKYFWDAHFDRLDLSLHKNFILGRILLYGDTDAVRFILRNIKREEIKSFLLQKGKQLLDSRSNNFWNVLVQHYEIWAQ